MGGAISFCAWAVVGAAAVAMFAAAGSRAQGQSSTPALKTGITYEDQSSETCEKQNAGNPYAGMNPLACNGEQAPTDSAGKCSLAGMTVWKQQGSTCYYCSPINPPINGIVIPIDDVGATEVEGWDCGLDQADSCMAVCQGGKSYTPPPGTVKNGGGSGTSLTGGTQQTPGPPLTGGIQGGPTPGPAGGINYVPGPNPCLPQGEGGYDYCQNGPGAKLPAGCVCPNLQGGTQQNEPSAGAQPASGAQQPLTANASDVCAPMTSSGYIACAPAENGQAQECECNDTIALSASDKDMLCGINVKLVQAGAKLSAAQVKTLQQTLENTRTMLTNAKAHVDNWDQAAQSESLKFFQSSDSKTKSKVSTIINAELNLLKNMNNVEQHIFPDRYAGDKNSPVPSWAAAYVEPEWTPDNYPLIFLRPGFWTGSSDWQAQLMVHELSHLNYAGGSQDLAYGRSNCAELAAATELSRDWAWWISKLSFGLIKNGAFPLTLARPTQMKNPFGYQLVLAPTPTNAALMNADSIAYFVHDLSAQP